MSKIHNQCFFCEKPILTTALSPEEEEEFKGFRVLCEDCELDFIKIIWVQNIPYINVAQLLGALDFAERNNSKIDLKQFCIETLAEGPKK